MSLTVNVIVVAPDKSATGVNVAVQFGTTPPYTILATGNKVPFEDVAAKFTAEQVRILSGSVTLKLTVIGVSSFVV